jgi:hypothetical protein
MRTTHKSTRAQDILPAFVDWLNGTAPPKEPGVYLTRRKDGAQFFRRFDGKRWSFGDKFASNVADSIHPIKPAQRPQLIAGWAVH